jgi:hypothetical protein
MTAPAPILQQDKAVSVRKRVSHQARQIIAEHLDQTDGHKCSLCRATGRLELDHINGDPSDNRLTNFRWLCKSCNLAARRLSRTTGLGECVSDNQIEDGVTSAEISINREKEPAYRKWLFERVNQRQPLYTDEAIYAGAEAIGCNPETTRRYLGKAVSAAGAYTTAKVKAENRTLKQIVFKRRLPE